MEKLKQTIESTLINNLDTVSLFTEIDYGSVDKCASYIAEGIKDIAIEFALWIADSSKHGFNKQLYEAMIINKCSSPEELFNQFINEKYK